MLSSPFPIDYLLRIRNYVGRNIQFWFCFWHQYYCIIVHGNWNTWAVSSSCNQLCGSGTQQRIRYCNNPTPQYGGNTCYGSNTDTQYCIQRNCPGNPLLLLLFRFPSHFQLSIGLFVNKIPGKKRCWLIKKTIDGELLNYGIYCIIWLVSIFFFGNFIYE